MSVEQNHRFKIDAQGNWFHNGDPIKRDVLVKLFADKGLKVDEEGQYWMQSPYEKYPVEVEDVPFIVIEFEENINGIDMVTNQGERIEVGETHPLELRFNRQHNIRLPYVEVRDGLYARLGRNVYYSLIQQFGPELKSRGQTYPLGDMDE